MLRDPRSGRPDGDDGEQDDLHGEHCHIGRTDRRRLGHRKPHPVCEKAYGRRRVESDPHYSLAPYTRTYSTRNVASPPSFTNMNPNRVNSSTFDVHDPSP